MGTEFINFLIFYMLLSLMYVMIGNIIFIFECQSYSSLFNAWVTITNTGMGNFNFTDFDPIENFSL